MPGLNSIAKGKGRGAVPEEAPKGTFKSWKGADGTKTYWFVQEYNSGLVCFKMLTTFFLGCICLLHSVSVGACRLARLGACFGVPAEDPGQPQPVRRAAEEHCC